MPELRRDPVVGYWTIISTERGRRPLEFRPRDVTEAERCPFCAGHEADTPPEVYSLRKPGKESDPSAWEVRVVSSRKPMLVSGEELDRFGQGIYDLMTGVGRHEIIIETPKHRSDLDGLDVGQIEQILRVYAARMAVFEKDARMKYALLFKNHGVLTQNDVPVVRHARSQLVGLPIIPKRVKEELASARSHFERRERCVFCDVLRQEIQEGARIVFQNESFAAFCPFASRAPFEMWVLPKNHQADFMRIGDNEIRHLAVALRACLAKLRILLDDPPYHFVLHTAPYRHGKKQFHWKTLDEDYHWFLLISPRLVHSAGFEWGTGIHINPTPPEEAAELLRDTNLPEPSHAPTA